MMMTVNRTAFILLISTGLAYTQTSAITAAKQSPRADTNYILGPEDTLTVVARDVDEMPKTPVRVDLQGNIRLPLIGSVHVAGLTVPAAEKVITQRLDAYIVRPEVVISVADFRSQPVTVLGAVRSPGIFQVQGRKTLVETLSLAGGLREDAGHRLIVTRPRESGPLPLSGAKPDETGAFTVGEVSINSIMSGLQPTANIAVMPNDVITVPTADLIYVVGEVHKPGSFPLRKEEQVSALQALSMAEGSVRTAAPQHAVILRREAGSPNRNRISVDLKRIMKGTTPDVPLQPEDILFVPNSASKNASLRAIEGAIQLGTGLVIWRW
jgi:polysaccharide export outer membrane protein